MLVKVSLAYCIVLALWTSVSGEDYSTNGEYYHQWNTEVEKCGSGDADERVYTVCFVNDSINRPYDSFNEKTIVTVHGEFELRTGSSNMDTPKELTLDEYTELDNRKTYSKVLRVDGGYFLSSQKNFVRITLDVKENGEIRLTIYVYAGSWGAVTCAKTRAVVESLNISF